MKMKRDLESNIRKLPPWQQKILLRGFYGVWPEVFHAPISKGAWVTVKTTNGGEVTAELLLDYRPTYAAVIDRDGSAVTIPAERIKSVTIVKEPKHDDPTEHPSE